MGSSQHIETHLPSAAYLDPNAIRRSTVAAASLLPLPKGGALGATSAPGSGESKSCAIVGPPGHAGSAVKPPEELPVDTLESSDRYDIADRVTETLHAAVRAAPKMARPR